MVSQLASMAPEVQVADAETAAALVLAACHSLAWPPNSFGEMMGILIGIFGPWSIKHDCILSYK